MGKMKQQRSNNGKLMTQNENIFQLVEKCDLEALLILRKNDKRRAL